MLTQERIKQVLHYEADTGQLIWKINKGSRGKAGKEAGSINPDTGYRVVMVDEQKMFAHRMIFLYMTSELPPCDIDHINGDRADNRWSNLRLCSRSENLQNKKNQRNNSSGVKGVYWHKATGKWVGQIKADGIRHSIGYFETLNDAKSAMKEARARLHGEFARHY